MTKQYQPVRFIFLYLLIILFACSTVLAESKINSNDSTFRVIRATPHIGLVVPHHEDMVYFINNFSYGMDINYGITKYDQSWFQYLNYPEIGFGLFYNSFGNSDIFGYGLSGYGYIQNNFINSAKFSLRSKVALGLGFVNKPYHQDENPYNHVFGSTLNVYINLGLFARYNISPRWAISSNLSINHLSNGSIKKPNHGINTVTFGAGVEYALNKNSEPQLLGGGRAPRSNARDVVFFMSIGRSQRSLYKPSYYPAMSLNINHLWWVSKKTAWGIGVDAIYYGAAPYEYSEDNSAFSGNDDQFSNADKMYGCLFGSYNFRFNHTQIFVHIGAYVLYAIKPLLAIYPRVGVRQQILKNLYANFSIKASFFKAEFIEFGLGYRFNYKKNTL